MVKRQWRGTVQFLCCLALSCMVLAGIQPRAAAEVRPPDYIHRYTVTLQPRPDGSMDVRCDVLCEVLDSRLMGPMTWTRLEVPGDQISSIRVLSGPVSAVKRESDGGNCLRVEFSREFKTGELAKFSVACRCTGLYTLERNTVFYDVTPGGFAETKVGHMELLWPEDGLEAFSTETDGTGGELKEDQDQGFRRVSWQDLAIGSRMHIHAEYPKEFFESLDREQQAGWAEKQEKERRDSRFLLAIVVLFIAVLTLRHRRSVKERGGPPPVFWWTRGKLPVGHRGPGENTENFAGAAARHTGEPEKTAQTEIIKKQEGGSNHGCK